MKRFWDEVGVAAGAGQYTIHLDGKPMRLPGGPALVLRCRALAEAVAAEWRQAGGGRGGELSAADLPLTQIAGTAQERVTPDPAAARAALARFGTHDVLCYRAASPPALAARQAAAWDCWLAWAERTLGARLIATDGVVPVRQPEPALDALGHALDALPPDTLAGLGVLVPALGSLVLGLAVVHGALPPDEAFALAHLDELHQAEAWGEDREAASRRRAVRAEIELAARYVALSQAEDGAA